MTMAHDNDDDDASEVCDKFWCDNCADATMHSLYTYEVAGPDVYTSGLCRSCGWIGDVKVNDSVWSV